MPDLRDAIAELLGITPQHGDEWTIMCPSPEHTDHRPSASIYVGEPMERMRGGKTTIRMPGMWVCYSCHRAGRIANETIETYEPSFDRNLTVAIEALNEEEARVYPEAWLDLYEYPGGVHPYWLGRFDEATCRRHRLGYDFERDCGTYPFRDVQGRVLGVVRRSFDTEATGWKYRYPKGIDKSANLYGYATAYAAEASVVVLVEGALDAVAVEDAGYVGLAIYGSRISAQQVTLINRLYPATIYLGFDMDEAGFDATEHAASQDWCTADLRVIPWQGNDPGELSVSSRRHDIARAVAWQDLL